MLKKQKTREQKLHEQLEKLRKTLKLLYPEYHWKHLKVFTAYWELRERICQ